MAADIHQLIAAINPDIYCEPSSRREVRRIIDAGEADLAQAYTQAVAAVQLKEHNAGEVELLLEASPFDLVGQRHPCERHQLVVDSLGEAPERIHFTLLSILERAGWRLEKMSDTLTASSGSAMGRQLEESLIKSQEHAARLFRAAHETLVRLLRDLETVHSLDDDRVPTDSSSADSALPSGAVETRDHLQKTRRSLLLSGIRSEVEALKTYACWLRPFLMTDRTSHSGATRSADLINAFNTVLFRVELLARNEDLLESELQDGTLPSWLASERFRRPVPVLVVEATFRTSPEQAHGGGFHHRGRVEVTLTSYALREDELRLLQIEREREDMRQMIAAVAFTDEGTLAALEEELNQLATTSDKISEPAPEDTNPFAALWDAIKSIVPGRHRAEPETTVLPDVPLKRDSLPEQILRSRALVLARIGCREVFSLLKVQLNLSAADPQETPERHAASQGTVFAGPHAAARVPTEGRGTTPREQGASR